MRVDHHDTLSAGAEADPLTPVVVTSSGGHDAANAVARGRIEVPRSAQDAAGSRAAHTGRQRRRMSPRPRKLRWYDRLMIYRKRSTQVPSSVLALLAIAVIALIAVGIGWMVYRS